MVVLTLMDTLAPGFRHECTQADNQIKSFTIPLCLSVPMRAISTCMIPLTNHHKPRMSPPHFVKPDLMPMEGISPGSGIEWVDRDIL